MAAPGDNDAEGAARRANTTGKRRAGSTASSKQEQQIRPATSEKGAQQPESPQQARQSSPKKKSRGFFSFLSCCGVPRDGNPVDQDDTVEPPKKTAKSKASRTTQPSPIKKQDPNAADSSTTNSREPYDEKTEAPHAAHLSAGQPADRKSAQSSAQGDANADKLAPNSAATGAQSSLGRKASGHKKTLPPLPTQDPDRLDASANLASPVVKVHPATPTRQEEPEEVIRDRTPEQQKMDTDIDMTDAPPTAPLASHDAQTAPGSTSGGQSAQNSGAVVDDLPPPPPAQDRQPRTNTGGSATPQSQDTSLAVTPAETQKWLLPPIRPEFRGKKCLVLDLDETLVHSSFKVSTTTPHVV